MWTRWLNGEDSAQTTYDEKIAKESLRFVIERALKNSDGEIPEAVRMIVDVDAARRDSHKIEEAIDELFAHTQMADVEYCKTLFKNATLEDLRASDDRVIQLAIRLTPEFIQAENQARFRRGLYLQLNARYVQMLREYKNSKSELLCPDANGTLRITFGHVDGYQKPVTGEWLHPFTYLTQITTKHRQDDPEFHVPSCQLDLVRRGEFAPYLAHDRNDTPMNFLAAVDITGGNSGSAALNKNGELIGLLFDGNGDALYSDWVFEEKGVRAILVDIRYVLWVLDKFANAKNILRELKIDRAD